MGFGVLLALVLLWRSVFVVDETEVALLTRFGRLEPSDYGAGRCTSSRRLTKCIASIGG